MSASKDESPGVLKSLDNWWFGRGTPTTMGVLRIFIGGLTFINFILISFDWAAWFSEKGIIPNWLGHMWQGLHHVSIWDGTSLTVPRLNLLSGIVDDRVALGFYILTCVVAFTTMIGLWTRASTIALAIGVVTLHHRNEAMLHGGDTVVRVMCLYLALSPCGRACSVDRLIRVWKGIETSAPIYVSLWTQRLVQYNVALIYFTTTWLKRSGSLWMDGTATYYPANLREFDRFWYPDFINSYWFVKLSTYGTLIVEFSLATLVFYKPCRKYVLLGGVLMHGWIEYSMNVPLFSYLMVSMYIAFYEGDEVAGWFRRLGGRLKRFAVVVFLPAGKRLSQRGIAFFNAVDPLSLVSYATADMPNLESGEVRKSWTHSLGALPWGWWPGTWRKLLTNSLEQVPEVPERATKGTKASH